MNPRQFFTSNKWWGKFIGAFFGYLALGPVGAFFGILIGNFFDIGLAKHFSRPHWSYYAEKRKAIQQQFFSATFSVMGHIAKADGRVSEHEIQMANLLMQEMRLSSAQKAEAKRYFNTGKNPDYNLKYTISMLQTALHDNPELLKLFIDIQYRAAQVDGLASEKLHVLNTILTYMGFATLQQQYRFYEDFIHSAGQHNRQNYSSSNQQHRYQAHGMVDQSYALLGISPTTNKQDVKRAYRRLMSGNHPDKLIAKGLPEEMIKIANEKTQAITRAYEQICEYKGW